MTQSWYDLREAAKNLKKICDGHQSQGEDLLPEAEGAGHDHLGVEDIDGNLIQVYMVLTKKEMVTYQTWFPMNTEEEDDRRQTINSGGFLSVQRKEGRPELS